MKNLFRHSKKVNWNSLDLKSLVKTCRTTGSWFIDCEYLNPNLGFPERGRPNVETDLCALVQIGCVRWDPLSKMLTDHFMIRVKPEHDLDEKGWEHFHQITNFRRKDIMDHPDAQSFVPAVQKLMQHLSAHKTIPTVVMLGDHHVVSKETQRHKDSLAKVEMQNILETTQSWYRLKPMLKHHFPGQFDSYCSGQLYSLLGGVEPKDVIQSKLTANVTTHDALFDACSMGMFVGSYPFEFN